MKRRFYFCVIIIFGVLLFVDTGASIKCEHQWRTGADQRKYKQYMEQKSALIPPCYLFECVECDKIAVSLEPGMGTDFDIWEIVN